MRLAAWLLAAALATSGPAWADLGEGLRWISRGQYGNAYRELKEGAEAGDVLASRMLGWMLERGIAAKGGQSLDARPEEAASWYRRAADGGDAHSATMLGILYQGGRGVPRDAGEALRWLARGGQNTAKCLEKASALPEADRVPVAAWYCSLAPATHRELRYPRDAIRRNSWGDVVLRFHAAGPRVEVASSDAIEVLRLAAENAARTALEVAPPPAEAVRHNGAYEATMKFTLEH